MRQAETHILLVEDTLTQAMFMQHILEQGGYKVTMARSGEKALDALAQLDQAKTAVDLVMTDINMPGMDGYELIQEVKKSRTIPCFLLLTPQLSEEVRKILHSSADGIVFKSNDSEKFLRQTGTALDIHRVDMVDKPTEKKALVGFFALAYQQILDLL